MKTSPRGIVIIGAGLAGVECAFSLRSFGEKRPITIVGRESSMPYDRPPLSKAYLNGTLPLDRLWLRSSGQYAEVGIDLHLGVSVTALDCDQNSVRLEDGNRLFYDQLILATGGEPRTLSVPGWNLNGVRTLKTLQDADSLSVLLAERPKVVVIGGGYVGLEFGATARLAGCDVTVIERQPRILARSAAPAIAGFLEGVHKKHGVNILTGAHVVEVRGESSAEAVLLDTGQTLAAGLVLVATGNTACDDLARMAGLALGDTGGVRVDAAGRTSDSNVYAIGDCASRQYGNSSQLQRLESVQSAVMHAKQVAAAITGCSAPTEEVPWFWTDQYDVKLQMAGLPHRDDKEILRGETTSDRFSIIYQSHEGAVSAIQSINRPGDFIAAKRLIANQCLVEETLLQDTDVPMREMGRPISAASL